MIISASRYTDIPAYYNKWFFKRVQAGSFMARNPNTITLIHKFEFSPETVDGIVFWTKNPAPMLPYLHLLKDYAYYFQFTINSYRTDVERFIPKKTEIIDTFKKLSSLIGKERIIWRYSPVFISEKMGYTLEYHKKWFGKLATLLRGFTDRCDFSFLNYYDFMDEYIGNTDIRDLTPEEKVELAKSFYESAKDNNITLCSCEIDLSQYGIMKGSCIDSNLLSRISGVNLLNTKDPFRSIDHPACSCTKAIDIGNFNTCQGGCLYCPANPRGYTDLELDLYDNPDLPILFDVPRYNDCVRDLDLKAYSMIDHRKRKSDKSSKDSNLVDENQISLF